MTAEAERSWQQDSGTVFCEGEVWKARGPGGGFLQIDDRVEVVGIESMVLLVKPVEGDLR